MHVLAAAVLCTLSLLGGAVWSGKLGEQRREGVLCQCLNHPEASCKRFPLICL